MKYNEVSDLRLTCHDSGLSGREVIAVAGFLCIADLDAEDGSFHGEGFDGHLIDADTTDAQAQDGPA